jgi:uncharacterized protein YutE (UPF0331/DUF86 family)
MTNGRLKEQCEAEFENIQTVLDELFTVAAPGKTDYSVADMAAVATFLHNAYNGIENVLKRTLSRKGIELKNAPTWHKDLLKISAGSGIISNDLHDTLSNYLSFRHFFVHAYSFTLRWEELKPLVDGISGLVESFKAAVFHYIESMD